MGSCSSQSLNVFDENSNTLTYFEKKKQELKILGQSRELLYYCSLKKTTTIINIIQSVDFDGCNINFQCGNGWTPLLHVCQSTYGTKYENDTQKIIKCLLSHGADVNLSNCMKWTPLMFSIKNNDLNSVIMLIKNGAQINCQNKIGYTPIMHAVMNNNDKILSLLLYNFYSSCHVSFTERCYDKSIWDYVEKNSKCEMLLKMYANKCVKDIIKNENKYLCTDVLYIVCDYLGYKH